MSILTCFRHQEKVSEFFGHLKLKFGFPMDSKTTVVFPGGLIHKINYYLKIHGALHRLSIHCFDINLIYLFKYGGQKELVHMITSLYPHCERKYAHAAPLYPHQSFSFPQQHFMEINSLVIPSRVGRTCLYMSLTKLYIIALMAVIIVPPPIWS